MSEYKVIFRADVDTATVTWEPPCPLMFEAIQIARHTRTAEAYLQGKVRNIGDQEISTFHATIVVRYEDGSEQEVEFKPLDADIVPGAVYQLTPVLLDQGTAIRANGRIESVKNEWGRTVWESSADLISPPEPIHLHLTTKAQDERSRLWAKAFSNGSLRHDPRVAHLARTNDADDHDEWWVCPCGQVNVNLANCLSCGLPLASWSEVPTDNETLEKIANERIKKEEEERAARKENKAANRKKNVKRFAFAGIVIAVLLVVFIFIIRPAQMKSDYAVAISSYEAGDYKKAIEEFKALGNFEDSAARKEQAEFMESVSFWLNRECKGSFFFAPYSENRPQGYWRDLECTIFLSSDGSCSIRIPEDEENQYELKYGAVGIADKYIGEWEGTWYPADQKSGQLTLDSFPEGENWKVELTEYQQYSSGSGTKKKTGPIIRSQSTSQHFYFNVFN